jgi:hypothetical protein
MSFLLSRNAAKCTLGSPSAKAVLRCLCDYADDDGTNCRPSTETISLETELDRRTVFKAVSFLSSNDWLKVFNAGRGSRNFYALNVQKINNGFERAKVTKEVFKSESGIKFDTSNENATSDKNVSGVVTFLQESGSKNDTQLYQDYTNTKSNIDARSESVEDELPLSESAGAVEAVPSFSKHETVKKPKSRGKATNTQATVAKPDNARDDLWEKLLEHRNAIKKPFNEFALKLMQTECKKAGWSLNEAIERVLAEGWIGFKASYVKDEWKDPNAVWVKAEDYQPELPPVEYAPSARECFDRIMAKSTYAYDIKDLSQLERVVNKREDK